jgi:hypothetical protein
MTSQTTANLAPQASVLGTANLCNHADNGSLCVQGEGVGNAMTVQSSNYAVLTVLEVGLTSNGNPILEFENPGGHCVYVNGLHYVVLENAGCSGKVYEEWRAQTGDYTGYSKLQDEDFNGYMLITDPHAGEVVGEGPAPGNYYNWKLHYLS